MVTAQADELRDEDARVQGAAYAGYAVWLAEVQCGGLDASFLPCEAWLGVDRSVRDGLIVSTAAATLG